MKLAQVFSGAVAFSFVLGISILPLFADPIPGETFKVDFNQEPPYLTEAEKNDSEEKAVASAAERLARSDRMGNVTRYFYDAQVFRMVPRTLGETRLWYAVLLPGVGLLVHIRWGLFWPNVYCCAMAGLFLALNVAHPEAHDQTLMPALQSPWFVPHVVVYLAAYAFLTGASLTAAHGLLAGRRLDRLDRVTHSTDLLASIGFSFLTAGLLFGALWAKQAWGHYWNWDPKETWALLTWMAYLAYFHIRAGHPRSKRAALVHIAVALVILFACWFGIKNLPAAQASVHNYANANPDWGKGAGAAGASGWGSTKSRGMFI